ncbi:hypothetical protein P8V03_09845 [Clostridium sp. A1-XYC3]|uniref:DUF960 domain-containing protein n=1 Tax=Clostridium tanneri TaxID=3037988 RepID=A0ABU4JU16_9CLOT|nr:hypothetical protein [Clostridium sp. A1-XYC3]MDW8801456.1 hypothetical protein [Clostridium sp. A1-XYC3]
MDIIRLKNWILDRNIEKISVSSFWKTFEVYRSESEEEFFKIFRDFNRSELIVKIQSVSLKLGNWPECDYNHIVVTIPIIYKNKNLGNYDLLFSLDGEIDDDYFVIF